MTKDPITFLIIAENYKTNIKTNLAFQGLDYNTGSELKTLKERLDKYKEYRLKALERQIKYSNDITNIIPIKTKKSKLAKY